MNMNDTVNKLIPSWKYRRAYIKSLLIFLCAMIVISLGAAGLIAFLGKFTLSFSTYLIVFTICAFMALIGIIGSYIFQASWENRDFLNILPKIIPGGDKDEENNT